jgi:hypothetical protein
LAAFRSYSLDKFQHFSLWRCKRFLFTVRQWDKDLAAETFWHGRSDYRSIANCIQKKEHLYSFIRLVTKFTSLATSILMTLKQL